MEGITMTYDTEIERCDIADSTTIAQNLYDRLTCAGLRHDLWPAAPGDDEDFLGNRLEEAFCAISDYIDAWKSS